MKRFAGLFAVLVVGPAAGAVAQVPLPPPVDPAQHTAPVAPSDPSTSPLNRLSAPPQEQSSRMSLGELTPTPQMWFYEQSRRQYEDPRAAVRANAEFRASQRMQRLAAQQWYGYSNARPTAAFTPTHTTNSAQWSGNVLSDPYRWIGPTRSTVVLLPDNYNHGLR